MHGDSHNAFLVAIIVPEKDEIKSWAKSNGVENMEEALENDDLKNVIIEDLNKLAAENKFTGLEKIKKVHLTDEEFT